MKKKKYKLFLILGVLIVLFLFLFNPFGEIREKRLIEEGIILINKIENFRTTYGRLPNRLEEIGIESQMGGVDALFYRKQCDMHYTIHFGTTLGESIIYYSESKQWKERNRVINP